VSEPEPTNQTHEQWCHDRIQTLETELACYQDEYRALQLNEVRTRRHHEVFLKAMEKLMDSYSRVDMIETLQVQRSIVEAARSFADLAYPPPKDEP
jgi:hypothetical protein